MNTTATPKQVTYALALMRDAGYSTDWMRAEHKVLAIGTRNRSGKVSDWLSAMSRSEISALISELQN